MAVTTFAAILRLNIGGGVFMQGRIFAGLFLVSLLGGGAQSPSDSEKPVWTMEVIRVKPGMFGFTLGYLDDNWMRVREEAKRQGCRPELSPHRRTRQPGKRPEHRVVDRI